MPESSFINYAYSDKIIVYPISVSREQVAYFNGSNYASEKTDKSINGYDGRSITEQNLSSLISCLIGNDLKGFVISHSKSEDDYNSIDFMLQGYYFKVTDTELLAQRPLFASLAYQNITALEYRYLKGDAVSSETLANDKYYYCTHTATDGATISFRVIWNSEDKTIYIESIDGSTIKLSYDSITTNKYIHSLEGIGQLSINFNTDNTGIDSIGWTPLGSATTSYQLTDPSSDENRKWVYYGLRFTQNFESSNSLQLIDEDGNIPIESYYKFRARDLKDIDAGTI